MAMFMAGYPGTTCLTAINRFCSSGLQAVSTIANSIRSGQIDIGIGGGFESMSTHNMNETVNIEKLDDSLFDTEHAVDCIIPMGATSENVAAEFGITRSDQDALALRSHRNAAAAQAAGHL